MIANDGADGTRARGTKKSQKQTRSLIQHYKQYVGLTVGYSLCSNVVCSGLIRVLEILLNHTVSYACSAAMSHEVNGHDLLFSLFGVLSK